MKTPIVYSTIVVIVCLLCRCTEHDTVYNGNSDSTQPHYLSYEMPADADLSLLPTQTKDSAQLDSVLWVVGKIIDTLSWRTFVALNWPTDSGKVDTLSVIGKNGQSPRVWELWMEKRALFLMDGGMQKMSIANLKAEPELPVLLDSVTTKSRKLSNSSKKASLMASGAEFHGRLLDQNSNSTFYQSYYSPSMSDYVEKGKLNTIQGQKEFIKNPLQPPNLELLDLDHIDTPKIPKVYFPISSLKDSLLVDQSLFAPIRYGLQITKNNKGAVAIKIAWKLLGKNDAPKKFYCKKMVIPGKGVQQMGMVAMHLFRKTSESTEGGVWSTFEHVGNAPDMGKDGKPIVEKGKQYYYFNPACETCPLNTLSDVKPTQVVRMEPISEEIQSLNAYFQDQFRRVDKNSVWQYYMLVGSQWQKQPEMFPHVYKNDTLGLRFGKRYIDPERLTLANVLIETSFQTQSSCMACHNKAHLAFVDSVSKKKYPADMVWGLSLVKRKK